MTVESPTLSSATRAMRDAIIGSADTPIVFDCVHAAGPEGIQFDVWYCTTYLPALAGEYRARRVRRYAAPSRASYVVVGELEQRPQGGRADVGLGGVPATVEHMERFIGEPIGTQQRRDANEDAVDAAVVYPAFLRIPHDHVEEIDRWYDEEHLPMLLSCPQWVMTRRFRINAVHGLEWNHVALHYLTDLGALRSPARDLARTTPWRDKLVAQGWFAPEYRVCYRLQDF